MKVHDGSRIPRLDHGQASGVQSLLLRPPAGPEVRHVLLRVPAGRGLDARRALEACCRVSCGIPDDPAAATCSLGVTFDGLDALGLPLPYLRVFQLLAPSFRAGAVRRSTAVGDAGPSSAASWHVGFGQERAHVIVSWHGTRAAVDAVTGPLAARWRDLLSDRHGPADSYLTVLEGRRLGAPRGEEGEWAHFGFRDNVSDVAIDRVERRNPAPDLRSHAPGALLLGWMDDEGLNRFSLTQAPDKVRRFFRSASFGVLRMMAQDIEAFETRVAQWQYALGALFESTGGDRSGVERDFVKAKLCGRWPDGRAVRPGARFAPTSRRAADYDLDLCAEDAAGRVSANDAEGRGCPFGSHVRRMQAAPDLQGHLLQRPLLRRSVPFGPAAFDAVPEDGTPRGQFGHFFCADIANQFEHLLGQWGARPPLGAAAPDDALDPLMGPHDDPHSGLLLPLEGKTPQRLTGFRPWTTTLGMAYAWYPGEEGLRMLFADDFVPAELAGPWL